MLLGLAQAVGGQINVGLPFTAGHVVFLLVLYRAAARSVSQGVDVSAGSAGVAACARVVHSTVSSRIGMTFWTVLVAGPDCGALLGRPANDAPPHRNLFVRRLASLWNFLAGYAGLVSVGQQTFVGLGGYTLYLCALWAGVNPMLGLPLAGLIGGLISTPDRAAAAQAARRLFHHRLVGGGGSLPANLSARAGGRRRLRHQPAGDRGALDRRLAQHARICRSTGYSSRLRSR